MQGHTNSVTCLAFSKDGKQLASGQVTHMGFQANIIVWDFNERIAVHNMLIHKVKVQAVAFSPSGKFLASLGGEDDNSVIVWDLAKGVAICGSPASKDSAGTTRSLAYLNKNDFSFVTGGDANARVWSLDLQARKIRPTDCQLGNIRRNINTVVLDANDDYFYAGTTTGDLLQISVESKLFKQSGPPKHLFSQGITFVSLTPNGGRAVIGCGDGTVAVLDLNNGLRIVNQVKLQGAVSTITFVDDDGKYFYAATSQSNLYVVDVESCSAVLEATGHYGAVNDLAFAPHTSELFATCANDNIRIWNAATNRELLRIEVPNGVCQCIMFKGDGSSLISGWSDGKVRAFGPQSGRLQYEITDAHPRGVTALACTKVTNGSGDFRIVSGGQDGQVRVWKVTRDSQTLQETMKEHKAAVTFIDIRNNDAECVSASHDGSCIVWDLNRFVRKQVMFQPCLFQGVAYFPDESQLLSVGTDRKVCYWEVFDGSLIREVEVSQSNAVNGLDIAADGKSFVVGGTDRLVKMYRYEEGDNFAVGVGHSADILKAKISPDNKSIYTTSADGSIFKWVYPVAIDEDLAQSLYEQTVSSL